MSYENKHRVRSLITSFEYGKLKKQGIVPKITMFNNIPKYGGSFPKMKSKVSPSWLGLYLDYFIRKILQDKKFKINQLTDVFNNLSKDYIINKNILELILKEENYFKDISNFILEYFKDIKDIKYEPEIISGIVMGHPDLIIDDTIYDIKMSGRFGHMRIETILQLLSYYSIYNDPKIKYIGVILPAQKIIEKINISSWNSTNFLNLLKTTAEEKNKLLHIDTYDYINYKLYLSQYIGSHVHREKTLYNTINKYNGIFPIQLFLGTNRNFKNTFSDKDIAHTLSYILNTNLHVYVHAPYTINLCNIYEDNFVVNEIKKQLNTTKSFNGKGVVIHIGKKSNLEYNIAYNNMKNNIIESSKFATKDCPILIETDSGGSILDNPKDLANFYINLPIEIKEKVAICIDTCHVFAAGYEITDTIKIFRDKNILVKLIHFNDSQYKFGTKQDRHASMGSGYIGFKKLYEFAKYSIENKIDLVTE